MADMKQAFLQINISKEHRDLLRFIWFERDHFTEKIVTYRFKRVVFGLNCSSFLLNATIKLHLSKYILAENFVRIIEKLLLNLYVDDLNNSFNTLSDAIQFYEISKECLDDGNFYLHKWAMNSKELNKFINKHTGSVTQTTINDEIYVQTELGTSNKYHKVLEINWDTNNDTLVIEFEKLVDEFLKMDVTKRNILKLSASTFDPLGLICPFILPSKVLFQKLCKYKIDWDSNVSDNITEQWKKYLCNLKTLKSIVIERHLFCCGESDVQLHGFCDSSGAAYSVVVFVRSICKHGVKVRLWCAKSCFVPVKEDNIPRLKLLGCVLLSEFVRHCRV